MTAERLTYGEPVVTGFDHVFTGQRLYAGRSSLQKIDVYEHPHFGRMLMLDDVVQTTQADEFCYHEMLVHPALCGIEKPERVLIIGGGDGGTLRRVLMHGPSEAVMCEIDEEVVRISREYLPSISDGAFDDPRARLVIGDGARFVDEHTDAFDAIIIDSTDPVGAAMVLFSQDFYASCRKALRPGGLLVSQTGSPMYQGAELRSALVNLESVFGAFEVYLGFVPTYPGVLWSFTSSSLGVSLSAIPPELVSSRLEERGIATRFYSPELHRSAFVLPPFVAELCATAPAASVPGR